MLDDSYQFSLNVKLKKLKLWYSSLYASLTISVYLILCAFKKNKVGKQSDRKLHQQRYPKEMVISPPLVKMKT